MPDEQSDDQGAEQNRPAAIHETDNTHSSEANRKWGNATKSEATKVGHASNEALSQAPTCNAHGQNWAARGITDGSVKEVSELDPYVRLADGRVLRCGTAPGSLPLCDVFISIFTLEYLFVFKQGSKRYALSHFNGEELPEKGDSRVLFTDVTVHGERREIAAV